MSGITPRHREALDIIARYIADHGCAPTYEELGTRLALRSKSGVARLVEQLEVRGYLTRTRHIGRSIELVDRNPIGHLSKAELIELRERITAELISRWGASDAE